ncbi:putative undecaprenyl pyrophosphate synthase [Escovopsis weberi]|uniref:ditrans,polycis-polyprenyl diphosphate synthase [(2E,6E)-farnesyldiphosphate specific] n=1 Tax=Escovopsis weberi TaxID=150374 RepID=A0A0M9VWG3_ESCWE|nr:putative undecaprenyl pyrophosphate synthase [Escovopsis weberi]
MPISVQDTKAYRADEKFGHSLLTEKQRQAIFKVGSSCMRTNKHAQGQRRSRLGVRRMIKNQIYVLIFALMHGVFSLYIKTRQAWHAVRYQASSVLYYHHGTPEYIRRDVMGLGKKPRHLSAVLKIQTNHKPNADLDRLIDETAELATWCACAEIPVLSVYEKTGILKRHMPRVYEAVMQKFAFYFGQEHPALTVMAPHQDNLPLTPGEAKHGHLSLHLISYQDGRESIVDLTRTLADMSQKGKISPQDISMELVDAELSEGIMPEPELLILFGPHVELSGYPPWQIRLTEIFALQDNESFGYQVFLKALRNYARAEFRRGR